MVLSTYTASPSMLTDRTPMNFRKFAVFMIFVALVGLSGSGAYKSSGDDSSAIAKAFYADEQRERFEQAMQRAKQGYADEDSVRATGRIENARAERRSNGQTGLMVFAGVGVLALGLLFSTKPAA